MSATTPDEQQPDPYRSGFLMSDEQFAQLCAIADCPVENRCRVRTILNLQIWNFRERLQDYRTTLTSAQMKKRNGQVLLYTRGLRDALTSDPEIIARLAGTATLLGASQPRNATSLLPTPGGGRLMLDSIISDLNFLIRLVELSNRLGHGGKEIFFSDAQSYPEKSFVASLIVVWITLLDRNPTNWTSVGVDTTRAAPFTNFVEVCFQIAGHPKSLEAVRKMIERVLRAMDPSALAPRPET